MNSLGVEAEDGGNERGLRSTRASVGFFVTEAQETLARDLAGRLAQEGYVTTVASAPRQLPPTPEDFAACDILIVAFERLAGLRKRQLDRVLGGIDRGSVLLLMNSGDLLDAITLVALVDALVFTDFPIDRVADVVEIARIGYTALPRGLMDTLVDRRLRDIAMERLTARERLVLDLLAAAYSNRDIGRAFGIREGTAKALVRRVLAKLGFRNRTEAAVYAFRQGRGRPKTEMARRRGRHRAKGVPPDPEE